MITSMRHKLVLKLYLTVGLVGLAAGVIGALSFGGALLFSLSALLQPGMGIDLDLGFVAMLLLGWFGLAAVGGGVALFALTRWWNLRKDGPAPDSASVGDSVLSRTISFLIFAGIAGYFGVTLVEMLGIYTTNGQLAASGATATAKITGYEPAPEEHADLFRVYYTFTTADGAEISDWRYHWRSELDELKKTNTAPVTYLPDNPAVRKMKLEFSLDGALESLGLYFSVFCVGVWGAGRNLGLWKRPDRRMPEPEAVLPSNDQKLDTLGMLRPRATFGRRGL